VSLINKLQSYYPGKYGDERIASLDRFIGDIDQADHERVFEWIIENRALQSAVGVADIKQACVALGVGFRAVQAVRPVPIECGACETVYKFLHAVSVTDQLEHGIHARCPKCGLPGSDQQTAEIYTERNGGEEPAWWVRVKDTYRGYVKDDRWGGGFWNPVKARAEERDYRMRIAGLKGKAG
jgi:hypothetical protein